jgi:hypothetical protein
MDTVVLNRDEVIDGVWEITAKLQVRLSISMFPCNGDGARLELDDPSVTCWTR